jgi:hypothetical protein
VAPTENGPVTSETVAMPFDRFATLIAYVVAFTLAALSRAQSDLWWLLRAGQDFWDTGTITMTETYSHTANGNFWPNQEWLWEAIAFALYHLGGMPLLMVGVALTVTATSVLMRLTSPATGYVVPLILLLAAPVQHIGWTPRPQVTSMLLFALVVLLISKERYRWLPLVFLLWANLHAQVVLGGVVLALVTATAAVQWWLSRTDMARRRVRRLLATLVLSAGATLVTPLGPRLWSYVLSAHTRVDQDSIDEWATAFQIQPVTVAFWLVVAVVAVAVVARRDRLAGWHTTSSLVATMAMAVFAILAVRSIPFFAVAVAPLLMTLLEFDTRRPMGLVTNPGLKVGGAAGFAALFVAVVWAAQPPSLAWHPVSARYAAALRACPGPLFNDYNTGAEIIWWVPDVPVFVDNRHDPYPSDVIYATSPPVSKPGRLTSAIERYDIECVLLNPKEKAVKTLTDDGWRPIYSDSSRVLLAPGKESRATSTLE